jgi:triacylglycerol lipase
MGGSEEENPLSEVNETRQEAFLEIAKKSPHGKIVKFISDEETDLQVGITISETNKRICVIFRGSESRADWYYDLQVIKKDLGDNIRVHQGFYNQLYKNNNYDKITNVVVDLLKQKQYYDYQVYITGHSLGAALSTLYGYQLSKNIHQEIVVASFASPRVGNSAFREDFDDRNNLTHYRFTNNRDIVTAAPMIYYQHVGQNIQLFDDNYKFFPNYEYNSWFSFSLFSCFRVSDHDCDLYYKRLLKNKW